MSRTAPATTRSVLTALLVASVTGVVVAGLLLPGGGLVVALVPAVTVLRGHRRLRAVVLALGAALLVLALGVHGPWSHPTLHVGPAEPAAPVGTPS